MDRKKFLLTASLAAFSVSTFGSLSKIKGEFVGDCDTTNDILGPFYRENAPTRQDLTSEGLAGSVVNIKGKVYQSDCVIPLKNALVEIWHCNTKGEYDNKSNAYHQRAKWYTNNEGEYSFKTILPGKYLNGSLYRPAHIHFRVSAQNSKELIRKFILKETLTLKLTPGLPRRKRNSECFQLA